jgi:hypothetical protein
MNIHLRVIDNNHFLEGEPDTWLLQTPEDIVDVIGACFENEARSVLLYAENLTEGFFDLSSGEAGAILQKLRNYRIRLAIVAPEGETPRSARFREMAAEESKGNDFRVFEDRASAEAWLVRS